MPPLRGVLEGRPVDALDINGDHDREGVLRHWELYLPLARFETGVPPLSDIVWPWQEERR